jgi:hypothetical protein
MPLNPRTVLLQGVQHLALSDWAGRLPVALLQASSIALLSLAVSDVSTAEGAAAAVNSVADPRAPVLHTAGGCPAVERPETFDSLAACTAYLLTFLTALILQVNRADLALQLPVHP